MYLLLNYPKLLYKHNKWIKYSIDPMDLKIEKYIILNDKLENYRKLLCISKEIGRLKQTNYVYS
jgi:hypothetical protein